MRSPGTILWTIFLGCCVSASAGTSPREEVAFNSSTVDRFLQAIRFQTVSYSQTNISVDELIEYQKFIVKSFPIIHGSKHVKWEVVNELSLLYTIQGSNSDLRPFMLAAHLDVVPVNSNLWEVPPFEGKVENEFIYGRGTIDDKHSVMGILEALEFFLSQGLQMQRTMYVALGCDEEVHGYRGAAEITKTLEFRGVKDLEFVLDEGMMITDGFYPGVSRPIASIGVGEKGYVTLRLSVATDPGHSSIPPKELAINILARAITRLEDYPQPHYLGHGPETQMLTTLSDYAIFPINIVYGNLWLFAPILSKIMSRTPVRDALQRTTTAVTMIEGGVKENVIPSSASAVVNHRVHPAQTIQEVIDHNVRVINDERVKITVMEKSESRVTSATDMNSFGYQMIKKSCEQVFPTIIVGPNLLVGATDCKWYQRLSKQIYNFTPVVLKPGDEKRFHGNNERISISNYKQVVEFYYKLILNSNEGDVSKVHHHSKDL